MKKTFFLLLATLVFASAASASNLAQTAQRKPLLKTGHGAECSLPSARHSKQCTGAQTPRRRL